MDYDIGIVGGGLAGLVAARIFASQGRSVVLFEAREFSTKQPQTMDMRSLALSLSSTNMLDAIGLGQPLASALTPIRNIHISSKGHFGVTRLHADELGVDAMGQVVEYHALQSTLLRMAEDEAAIELCLNTECESLHQHEDRVELKLNGQDGRRELDVGLLLVADGGQSAVRDALGISTDTHDYQQSAIIANIEVDEPAEAWAYERFTPNGPLALLPLGNARYALIWTRNHADAEALMRIDDDSFLSRLQLDFGYRLGRLLRLGRRDRFDLTLRRANQLVAGRCVLIGNAANTLHPVAGQGFNLALRDIGQLYDLLQGVELTTAAASEALESYGRMRVQDHRQTIAMGHGLVSLFSNDWPILRHARGAGLAMLDLCPTVKQAFAWHAMGFGSGVNSLMRSL